MTNYWQAIEKRDHTQDGRWVYGVKTTGIFCRPSCSSRKPNPGNVRYFVDPRDAETAGFRPCLRCRPLDAKSPQAVLAEAACRYIDSHAEAFRLDALAKHMGYSPFHLQRAFKAALGVTPRAYAEGRRVAALKQNLRGGLTVTDAVYQAGFSSPSSVYEQSDAQLGMTPATYGKSGLGARIRFQIAPSPLGLLLVAQTGRGVCSVALGDSEKKLQEDLASEFPRAEIVRSECSHLAALLAHLEDSALPLDIPLDIRATAFQRRVWEHLQTIPASKTRSYSQIARDLNRPLAARAVAKACATNPVALAIPCHRVVREDGSLSGYRWGVDRKRALLDRERKQG